MATDNFVWYELVTGDVDAALDFYRRLFGWETQEFPGGEHRYVILTAKGKGVGGVMALPEGMSEPFWLGYIGTRDIDSAVDKLRSAGGTVYRGPWEIPTVGRLALVSDPQGAGFALIQEASARPGEAFDQMGHGRGSWRELRTTDPQGAFGFYAAQFGWTKGDAMDMGAMGTYQIFKADDAPIGGMMRAPGETRPSWLYYFGIDGVDGAVSRIEEGGGAISHGPTEVPGGAFIVQARDPQGAAFAVVGPRG